MLLVLCGTAVATPAANPCAVRNRVNGVSTDGSGGTDTTYTYTGDSVFEITGCNNTLSSNNATNVTVFGNGNVVSDNEVRAEDSNGDRVLTIGMANGWVNNSVITSNVAGPLFHRQA
jgi:archaellum component FlaG (FlaF/FlaG flagellin family)